MITQLVKNAQEALELKQQVQDHGLELGRDFSWEYRPDPYDGYDDGSHAHPEVEFTFQDAKMETFFSMRWAK